MTWYFYHNRQMDYKKHCTLSKFCNNWMKTKIVIFQKKCKKSTTLKHQFYINNENIEITNSYTYLGVKFSTNGSFKELKAIPKVKAKRAIFATRQHLNFLRLPIDISNRLLNSLYLPILMALRFGASTIKMIIIQGRMI